VVGLKKKAAFTELLTLCAGEDEPPPPLGVPSVKKLADIVYIVALLLLSGSTSKIRFEPVYEAVTFILVL